jgi:hypothetical protein
MSVAGHLELEARPVAGDGAEGVLGVHIATFAFATRQHDARRCGSCICDGRCGELELEQQRLVQE